MINTKQMSKLLTEDKPYIVFEWHIIDQETGNVDYFDDLDELEESARENYCDGDFAINPKPFSIRLKKYKADPDILNYQELDEFYIENGQLSEYGDQKHKCPIRYIKKLSSRYPHLIRLGEAK